MRKVAWLIAPAGFFLVSTTVLSADLHATYPAMSSEASAFIPDLPFTTPLGVVSRLHEVRADLLDRREVLVQVAAERSVGPADVFVAVVMPGGLVYAAYRMGQESQAKSRLGQMEEALSSLNGELEQFAAVTGVRDAMVTRVP